MENSKLWKITVAYLEHARKKLPESTEKNSDEYQRLLESYHNFLEHNELELALDALEELGDLVQNKGGFWKDLERAATTMELKNRASRFHEKFLEAIRVSS
jgi:hypothetical protein